MSKIVLIVLAAALIGGGIYVFRGGSVELGSGVPDGAQIISVQEVLNQGKAWAGREVTLRGEMTQKCPTSGCWFYMKDDTGDMRVDTAPSGFTISEIPLGKTITVYGKVVMTEGGSEMVALGVKS
jgi:uncharacterized protein YdeI (BOF family)